MHQRVVLITGASSGIGAALALQLAETSRLALVARRHDRLGALVERIADQGGTAVALPTDLAEPGAPAAVVRRCLAHFGGLSAVVNNAGLYRTAAAGTIDPRDIERQLRLNLAVPMLLTEAAIGHLERDGGGWVVNISSIAAARGFPTCGVYGASKAGLEAWSASLREDLRGRGIRVGVVRPGPTDTEVWGPDCPFDRQRMARAEDVARAVVTMLDTAPTASLDRIEVMPPGGTL